MKFAMFFLGEYTHVITVSFLVSVLFLGGWHFPWIAEPESNYTGAWLVKCGVLVAKVAVMIIFIMLIRWTLPRFRFDQLMSLAWQGLVPLAFINLALVAVAKHFNLPLWLLTIASIVLFVAAVAWNGINLQRRLRSLPAAPA
jgi:NADH-quinone oxidoreductase subunit H